MIFNKCYNSFINYNDWSFFVFYIYLFVKLLIKGLYVFRFLHYALFLMLIIYEVHKVFILFNLILCLIYFSLLQLYFKRFFFFYTIHTFYLYGVWRITFFIYLLHLLYFSLYLTLSFIYFKRLFLLFLNHFPFWFNTLWLYLLLLLLHHQKKVWWFTTSLSITVLTVIIINNFKHNIIVWGIIIARIRIFANIISY